MYLYLIFSYLYIFQFKIKDPASTMTHCALRVAVDNFANNKVFPQYNEGKKTFD